MCWKQGKMISYNLTSGSAVMCRFTPVFLPDPFQPRFYVSAAFSPAGYAKCTLFCQISVWAGYGVVKVR